MSEAIPDALLEALATVAVSQETQEWFLANARKFEVNVGFTMRARQWRDLLLHQDEVRARGGDPLVVIPSSELEVRRHTKRAEEAIRKGIAEVKAMQSERLRLASEAAARELDAWSEGPGGATDQ